MGTLLTSEKWALSYAVSIGTRKLCNKYGKNENISNTSLHVLLVFPEHTIFICPKWTLEGAIVGQTFSRDTVIDEMLASEYNQKIHNGKRDILKKKKIEQSELENNPVNSL